MSEHDTPRSPDKTAQFPAEDEGGLHAPSELGPLGKFWWWFHFAILVKLARLRFLAILGVIGASIVYWDTLVAYWEKGTRPFLADEHVADSDTEYFCPMHPQVVTANPREKCPICFMNLTKRKKGDSMPGEALPPGVVQRLQLTPVQGCGVRHPHLAGRLRAPGEEDRGGRHGGVRRAQTAAHLRAHQGPNR
jgi:hypothetical protein